MSAPTHTTKLHHEVDGPADAQVLVLGPSLGTDVGLFDQQVSGLAARYRIVRFDLPGHGRSPTPSGPYTVAAIATDVVRLLDRLHVRRFHYAGVSFGGAIGQQLALDQPGRLLSLAVCASAARFREPRSWLGRAAVVRADGTGAMLRSRIGTWYTHEFAHAQPREAQRLLDMLLATRREGYAGCCEALAGFDVRSRLGEIRVPTLALAGAEDPVTPPEALRQIADAIPGADLVVIPRTAHLLNVEAPEVVNQALAAHVRSASPPNGQRSYMRRSS